MTTLTLKEAAAFLRIHKTTLAKLAQRDVVPGAKVGRDWRFLEDDLVAYIRRPCQSTNVTTPTSGGRASTAPASLGYVNRLEKLIAKQRSASTTS